LDDRLESHVGQRGLEKTCASGVGIDWQIKNQRADSGNGRSVKA
jgi:hypothetical protein